MEKMDTANISGTCQFAIFIAPVERETITKVYRPWSSSLFTYHYIHKCYKVSAGTRCRSQDTTDFILIIMKHPHACLTFVPAAMSIRKTQCCESRDDNRLSETPEPSIVAWVPVALPMVDFNLAQIRRKEYARTYVGHDILQMTSTSEEALDLVVGPLQLGGIHPEDGPNSRHRLENRQMTNFNVSLFLPNPSVSDCSRRWPIRHWSVPRPWCLHRNSTATRSRTGIHADLLIQIDIRSVLLSKFLERAEASRWLLVASFNSFILHDRGHVALVSGSNPVPT